MPEPATIQFVGAAGTVTGSKHLVRANGHQILLDCGLFQGLKTLRLRNWAPPPFDPGKIDAVVLSHAHIDHSGALPLLVRQGFRGPIFCTPATQDLLRIMLLDSAHLQEEEAEVANRYGYSKHHPALPLYRKEDAEAALSLTETRHYREPFEVVPGIPAILRRAGHILGSATIELRIDRDRLVYSGDLGRWGRPILRDPECVEDGDVLVVESTYGDRIHPANPVGALARIVREAALRGGALIIPAFAVGRTQELLWTLRTLEDTEKIPTLPVYLDSPMAIDVTDVYCRHPEEHDLELRALTDRQHCPLSSRDYHLARTVAESKALNEIRGPFIVIAGSGMATGGRVLHHLKMRLPDDRTTVLLSGFQAQGTRGRRLDEGSASLRIHGSEIAVRARIERLNGLSAHADQAEILRWLAGFRRAPSSVWIVHGEPNASEALAHAIRSCWPWNVIVPKEGDVVPLEAARSDSTATRWKPNAKTRRDPCRPS